MDKNEIKMTSEEVKPVEKIKAINPVIIVNMDDGEPYYSIQHYDSAHKAWYIGCSSNDLDYVRGWLAEYLEPIEADLLPVKYGRWNAIGIDVVCSECGCSAYDGYTSNYCPDCGAKMILED